MDHYIAKLKNFWFYYKKHLLIALAVLLTAGWLTIQRISSPKPDYHIGLVRATPCTEEELKALEDTFAAAGIDLNGDGQTLVQIHTYYVDLADNSPNADADHSQIVSALDADLIGHVSGIFLLEDVVTFQQITNDAVSGSAVPFGDGLFLVLRTDADDAYIALTDRLS